MDRIINHITNSPHRINANKNSFKFGEVLKENKESFMKEQSIVYNESLSGVVKGYRETASKKEADKKEKQKALKESAIFKRELLGEAFANIVLEAFPIDENNKEILKEDVINFSKSYLYELMNEGTLLEGTDIYQNYVEPFVYAFDELDALRKSPADKMYVFVDRLKEVEDSIDKDSQDIIVKNIAENVKDVFKQEQFMISNKEKLLKENKNYNGVSLFNSINFNVYETLKESAKIKLESSEGTDTEFKAEVEPLYKNLEEEALVKTTLLYTVLESLNVTGLYKFNSDTIRKESVDLFRKAEGIMNQK